MNDGRKEDGWRGKQEGSALALLVARLCFADDVQAALALDDLGGGGLAVRKERRHNQEKKRREGATVITTWHVSHILRMEECTFMVRTGTASAAAAAEATPPSGASSMRPRSAAAISFRGGFVPGGRAADEDTRPCG
jgi:hypothetical protein